MARARNIKPGFFLNEDLGTADPFVQLLFAGLWCLADKEGRLEDRPLRIKAEIFPYRENLDVNGYLTVLSRLGFIVRYVVEGKGYIEINNFKKHQNPHHTEKNSTIPGSCNGTVNSPLNNGENPADSLIPDSLIPDSLIPDSKEKTICAEQSSSPAEFSFILSDKSMFDIPNEILDQWADLYLGIDIRKELQKLVDWCVDNPRKRKTREGAMRFVRSWLNRADDRSREEADSFTMDDYLKQCGVSYGD